MSAFDQKYWNLCQAAVWVEFRESELVERFAVADADAYQALHFYPGMWPQGRKKYSDLNELYEALKLNSLRATGYHTNDRNEVREIADIYWNDIDLRPPFAWDKRRRGKELWTNVRVRRSDILRLWPRPTKKVDRSLFDWDAIRQIYDDVLSEGSEGSDRDMVLAIQDRFQKRFKIKPPGRTSLLTKITHWRAVAT